MDDRAFSSKGKVFLGAVVAGLLFGLVQAMANLLMVGELRLSRDALALGGVAFWAYLLVGTWIRRNPRGGGR
jgi:hypothetical protein